MLGCRLEFRVRGLFVFELKLKLTELAQDLLALRAEDHVLQLLDHKLQMFDSLASRVQLNGLVREGLSMRLELCFKANQLFIPSRDERYQLLLLSNINRDQRVTIHAVQIRN